MTLRASIGQIRADWETVDNGNAISAYDVEYRTSGTTSWTSWTHSDVSTTATITSLTNGTAYDVRVSATNSEGTSDWSDIKSATPVSSISHPSFWWLSGNTNDRINATIAGFPTDVTHFILGYQRSDNTVSGEHTRNPKRPSGGYTFHNFTKGWRWDVRLKNCIDTPCGDWSGWSEIASRPDASTSPTTSDIEEGSVTLGWTKPAGDMPDASWQTGFSTNVADTEPATILSSRTTGSSMSVTGLTRGTEHKLFVRTVI